MLGCIPARSDFQVRCIVIHNVGRPLPIGLQQHLGLDLDQGDSQACWNNKRDAPSTATATRLCSLGEAGALDHFIATPGAAARVSAVQYVHVNTDEPDLLYYHLAGPTSGFCVQAHRVQGRPP
eukprot:jgi/Chlat1/6123/Chrsp409S05659